MIFIFIGLDGYFFTAFLWMEACTKSCGLAFDGYRENGSASFDKIIGSDYWGIESALNLTEHFNCWNT